MEEIIGILKAEMDKTRNLPDFRVKTANPVSINEEYGRHYSRKLEKTPEKDFSTKKNSRRIYFTEFFTFLSQLPSESLTLHENSLLECIHAHSRGHLDLDILSHFTYLLLSERTWNKKLELKILREASLRLRFIRWFMRTGAALACCSSPESHLLALQHGSELLEAAKRLELVRSISVLHASN